MIELNWSLSDSNAITLSFRCLTCFEQGVHWHSGKELQADYRVKYHSKTCMWYNSSIQLPLSFSYESIRKFDQRNKYNFCNNKNLMFISLPPIFFYIGSYHLYNNSIRLFNQLTLSNRTIALFSARHKSLM